MAAEEYLLKTAVTDTFMIWRNVPSVIIGKHQNAWKEINHSFVEASKLPVIRRISGGGTVYHDLGNINFSFIYINRKENLIDFRYFTKPIILFLKELGLNASFKGKNNITLGSLKVSGNSAHIYKNIVLHHGTLLFNSDLDALEKAIAGREAQYNDKSVRSVHATVTNISGFLKEKISEKEFMELFQSFICRYFSGAYHDKFTGNEKKSILKLVKEKYKKHEWNFGYSPEYKYNDSWTTLDGIFSVSVTVKDGLIQKAEISGPGNHILFLKEIADQLTDELHEKKSISEQLKKLTFADEKEEHIVNQIIQHLF